jgi:hypothetical protein
MRKTPAILLALALASCSQNKVEDNCCFFEDGRAKPSIAIASMLDRTSYDANWSLSEELTSSMVKKIADSGIIFVNSHEESPFVENPFGTDLSWMKREFMNQEFVVFTELVQHENIPTVRNKNLPPNEVSNNLNMAVRIRVVDLRSSQPKIVLQELVKNSYFIAKSLIPTDYSTVVWGSDEYNTTPLSHAHELIVNEIVERVSEYVVLAKSR